MSLFPPPALQSIYGSVLSTVTVYPSQPPPSGSVAVTNGLGGSVFVPLANLVPEVPFSTLSTSVLAVSTILLKDNTSNSLLYAQGGQLYINDGPVGVASNYAFSNLRVMDTLSTSSTFTEFLSASQLLTSSITFNDEILLQTANVSGIEKPRIAIGLNAGYSGQQTNAIAIGTNAGNNEQGDSAVAIGTNAGQIIQIAYAVAIGNAAGTTNQQTNAIAIGNEAGNLTQSEYSIAIGYQAGKTNQAPSTIILNASGAEVSGVSSEQGGSFYVAPIRPDETANLSTLSCNPFTYEITYGPTTSISSNYAFSNLSVTDTLSTTSTSTDYNRAEHRISLNSESIWTKHCHRVGTDILSKDGIR